MSYEEAPNTSGVEVTLSRDLGLLEVLMIGLGPNIGSSIFLLIGIGAGIAGPALIVAFVLNFIVTIFTAMAYAELASAFPETGGGYLWIKEGLFPPFGFLGGWMSWIGHCIACSVYAIGFGQGVQILMQEFGISFFGLSSDLVIKVFSAFIAIFFCYLNYRGVKGAGRSEILVSVFLVGILILFCLFGLAAVFGGGEVAGASGFGPLFVPFGYLSIAASMGFTFMIFEGYEVVAQTGEEAKNPERTVPRAMFLCITISCILFVVIAIVTFAVIGWQEAAQAGTTALSTAAARVVPLIGAPLIALGMIVGSVAAVNSVVFSSSRVSFAMGRDGNLPLAFGRLNAKRHTPTMAIIVSGVVIVSMVLLLNINDIASAADVLILLLFVLVNIAALTLRRRRPDVKRHFLTPFYPWIPLIGIGSKIFLAAALFSLEEGPFAWYLAIAIIYGGLLVHYFAKGRREIEKVEAPPLPELSREAKMRYRVLVPTDDPKNIALIDLGCLLAAKYDGELLITSVLEVPTATPLDAVEKRHIEEKKRMLEKLKSHAELKGVQTRAIVLVSHDVVTSIIDTAKENEVNLILLGWKGYTRTQRRILGKKMDDILKQTPCDVLVLKAEGPLKPDNILILSGGLWHVSKATEIAADIAAQEGSRVTILNVIVNERYMIKAAEYSQRLRDIVATRGVPVIVKDVRPETIVGGVVAESLEHDLLVIGSSAAKRWDQFAFGPIQDSIAKNARSDVLVYKRVSAPSTRGEDED